MKKHFTSWPWGEDREMLNGATIGFLIALPYLAFIACITAIIISRHG